ncbi:DUF1638 domain-containing protein [candidate division KSB1 bacterium]|nr:DUF1638 domain-containing protein [candidate division KSB1 bacterium]
MSKLVAISCQVLWRELCYYGSMSPHVIEFKFLEQGLHDTPNELRRCVQENIDAVDGSADAILLGYGLCSNGLAGIHAGKTPLVVIRGHDCITFFLGSREKYRDYFDRKPGTYWYTPGWIDCSRTPMPGKERYDQMLAEYTKKYGADNAEYLMEMEQRWYRDYTNAAYVDLGFFDTEHYRTYTRECSRDLNWSFEPVPGDSSLIERWVRGEWESEDFLVVQPGQEIVASHDDLILKAE